MDWEQKYLKTDGLLYGHKPALSVTQARRKALIPDGRVLFIGDGEGRHSRWLARQGYNVIAVDISKTATNRALVEDHKAGIHITRLTDDIANLQSDLDEFSSCFMLFLHFSPAERDACFSYLRAQIHPKGRLFIEGFGPEQIHYREKYHSGGPAERDLLYCPEQLMADLHGFKCLEKSLTIEKLDDGPGHQGPAQICRMVFERL